MLIISLGLDFIKQLCLDDENRAATLVAVSNKYVFLKPLNLS